MYSSQQSWLGRLINSSINAFRQEAACTVSAYFLTESGSKLSRLSLKMGHRSGSFVNPMLRPVDCQRVPLILSAATASDDSA